MIVVEIVTDPQIETEDVIDLETNQEIDLQIEIITDVKRSQKSLDTGIFHQLDMNI